MLGHSVGKQGGNLLPDVRQVQALLNRHLPPLATLLRVDGLVGPKTMAAILHYQQHVVGLHPPDGLVEPHGPTLHALLKRPGHGVIPHPPKPRAPVAPATTTRPITVRPSATRPAAPPPPLPPARPKPPLAPAPGGTVAWGAKVSPLFKSKAIRIAQGLGIPADFLMSCMAFESGESFRPDIRNAAGSGAVGLIQFMPSTARGLGTSTAELAAMTAEAQLDYVEKYFRPYRGRIHTIEDIYMVILYPKAVGKDEDYTLFSGATKAYSQNKGLDGNRDGAVSKFEAASAVRAKYNKGIKQGYIG